MTGFEVAGVVLGAIPLIFSGLEYYSDGVRAYYLFKTLDTDKALSRFP